MIATALLLATTAGAAPPYSQLAKLYAYAAAAPLDVREAGVTTEEGIAVHDLSYASPVRGRVPAYLVLPAGEGPFPVVLYAPGSNGTRDDFLGDARLLAKRGLAGLLFTPPHNRPGGPLLTLMFFSTMPKDCGPRPTWTRSYPGTVPPLDPLHLSSTPDSVRSSIRML